MLDTEEIRSRMVVSSLGVMAFESTKEKILLGSEEVVVERLVVTVPVDEETSGEDDDWAEPA